MILDTAKRETSVIGQMEFSNTIDGETAPAAEHFDVFNPATGTRFATSPGASASQLDDAVAAARRAFLKWRSTPVLERRSMLHAFASSLRQNLDILAPLLTLEQGKPLFAAKDEISRTSAHIVALADINIGSERLRENQTDLIDVHYRPLGVVGAIAPWNMPVLLGFWKVAHALYTGNCVVLKPSPYTPLTTLKIGEIARDIFPRGVLNVIAGGNELGSLMTEHRGIDKVSFTGSGPTGKKVLASAAGTLKRVTLELGGNDPAFVLPDADIGGTAKRMFWGAFVNSGQICKAIKRFYVHESIYEETGRALASIAESTRLGNGLDEGVELGPVQNRVQYDIVMSFMESARKDGGRFLCGGAAGAGDGYFIQPTIVMDLSRGNRLVEEEQFGPVLPVIPYSNLEDAIADANDSRFGLSASVWTANVATGREIAAEIDAGTIWVNRHGGSDPFIPFGGAKESGLGRENSVHGLREYMQARVVQSPALVAYDE